MTIVSKLAIAAVLVAAAGAPALAQGVYVGVGPAYADGYAYSGYPYGGYYAYGGSPYYSGAYAYAGEPYYGRRWYGPRYRHRYAPATSDFYHNSRQLQGTR
jgi:hypothetical protein